MFPYKYICIEGNIGAGKTSFCNLVKSEFNCKLILEQFADNPFLPLFYDDPERYAFTVELFFMTERYKQLQKELSMDLFYDFTIADYSFIKTLLFARQNLGDEEFRLFQKMFSVLNQSFPTPDLFVYFHRNPDILQKNIGKRGRSYEKKISDDYLSGIQNAYFEYFRNILTFPLLIIDLNDIDFMKNRDHYEEVKSYLSRTYLPGVHRLSLSL
ncbi:MAG: deoxynucleoside kinase [Saprospiraceae bacterium]|nr:deoxynucleoside kinase [Saprospiraceae bacterium]MBK8632853.1 deoxynucleoside kinase [Saprospiraceae bacterium]MBP7641735.1 deoxynucleoside kinase [Saprospiraceae bacterium]HMS68763.1 deoxynucleoside kinase [Saprospiraceae bacterium]